MHRVLIRNARQLAKFPPKFLARPYVPFSRNRYNSSSDRKATKDNLPVLSLSDAQRQTVYALSSPPGKAGVGVIRISGPDASAARDALLRTSKGARLPPPEPWKFQRCRVIDPERTEKPLDDGLAVFFKGPKSFTTEDVLEIHIHSGRAVVAAVLTAISRLPSCRPAEPGEFTRRAFNGGRLDLTQVEGLRDLIDAETESQRAVALRTVGGEIRERFESLRGEVIHVLAMVEALIDFGEGEDLEEGVFEQGMSSAYAAWFFEYLRIPLFSDLAREEAKRLNETIQSYLNDNRRGEIIRNGIRLAIFGPPNAGKSSLLNFLAQRDAAIVTPIPGTTRDILEVSLDVSGLPVIVTDTAGLRQTEDVVESIGVERAKKAVQDSDISLCVLSLPEMLPSRLRIPTSVQSLISSNTCFLFNKTDLLPPAMDGSRWLTESLPCAKFWSVSLTTGEGTEEFLSGLASTLRDHFNLQSDGSSVQLPMITHARHRSHLETASRFIEAFLQYGVDDVVLGAEELRYAAQAVGKVSGLIDVEDVLDVVFRDFCIGK
ncbi:tRNA modification GTPase TrmE [Marasmius fiardii PR-910]|nr:tRNA modification GTPase TrmE [Marasmius fiardii PR-910]